MLITPAPNAQKHIGLDRSFTDLLRLAACCMVALGHFSSYAVAKLGCESVFCRVAAAQFGYLGVAVFFFLSGSGLMRSALSRTPSFASFFSRRLRITYFPAVLVSLIWLIVSFVVTGGGDLLCNQEFFLGVIWWFNDEVLWFVRTIIILYAVFFLYIILFSQIPKWGNVLLMLFMTAMVTFGVKYWRLGDPISVPLFFVGMAVAQWQEQVKHLLRSWIPVLLFLIIVGVAILGRFDNRILHGVINYAAILCLLILCAFYNIQMTTLPKWVGECSYDIYLTHNKIHLLIIHLFTIDRLWMFVVGASVAAFLFYSLRKLLNLV